MVSLKSTPGKTGFPLTSPLLTQSQAFAYSRGLWSAVPCAPPEGCVLTALLLPLFYGVGRDLPRPPWAIVNSPLLAQQSPQERKPAGQQGATLGMCLVPLTFIQEAT